MVTRELSLQESSVDKRGSHTMNFWKVFKFICPILLAASYFPNGISGQNSTTYYRVDVSEARLAAAPRQESAVLTSLLTCTMKANVKEWSDLLCFREQTCELYELSLLHKHKDNTPDAIDTCYTRVYDECKTPSGSLKVGEMIYSGPSCTALTCTYNGLQDYGSNKTCSDPNFTYIGGIGCIYKVGDNLVTYDTAAAECDLYGAHIVMPPDFKLYQKYLACISSYDWHWVNVQGVTWNDGRPVDASFYGPGQPEHTDECTLAYYESNINAHALQTNPCHWGHHIFCQL